MKLKDFYDLWYTFGENGLIIIDIKEDKTYYDFYNASAVWEKEVYRFNISDNNLYIIIK
jgi:hypothetical protein